MKTIATLVLSALILAGCGGTGDSGMNPGRWFSRIEPETLAPEGGYTVAPETRPGVPQILTAEFEPLNEGLLLVVTGIGATKGYHDAELITASPQPAGRMAPDPDGVLRLRFVALPPLPDDPAARLPARPETDTITTALPLSSQLLARITAVEISGAANSVLLTR